MNGFLEKAQSRLKTFEGLPKQTHPLWKGFPLRQWQKELDEREWGTQEFVSDSFDLSRLPFSVEEFSVLLFKSGEIVWLKDQPDGVEVTLNTMKEAFLSDPDSFTELSLATALSGLKITVPAQTSLKQPLLCLFAAPEGNVWQSYSHRVVMGEGSKASLVFLNTSSSNSEPLISHLLSGDIGKAASFSAVQLGSLSANGHSFARFDFVQKKDSVVEFIDFATGAKLGRTECHCSLKEPQALARISGIHLLKDSQVYDSRVRISHEAPETYSTQNFKCVAAGQSQSLYGGNVLIQKDAQKVASSQSHKALLVSKGAKASAFPELEVHADDVKAAHGSSTGQMNQEEIFYLKSRGLSQKDSIHLLSEAFVKDVVLKVSDVGLRKLLERILEMSLPDFVKEMESRWQKN